MNKLTVGSLFAGVGGICSAFKQAGCSVSWANEYNHHACETYRLNYKTTNLYEEDINSWVENHFLNETVEGKLKIKSLNEIDIPKVDILTSGFPCQAFSIAGYRQGFNDTKGRGNLFFRTAEVIEGLQPKAFLLENVKNLAGHDNGKTIKIIEKTIRKDLNYSFIMFILNSSEYGNTPQNRERVYIVGFRGEGTFSINDKDKMDGVLTHKFEIPKPIKLKKTIHSILSPEKVDERFYYKPDHQYFPKLDETMKSRDTVYQWRRVYVRENKSNVCPTLTANMGTGGHNVPLIRDDYGIRKLTPDECIGFQGFPKTFKFPKDMAYSHRYKQAGNSVVVPVVKRIADEIVKVLQE
jgi:DNA (cytosine-5)-methyltransferase 1